ncbi:MAG: hypothetical protein HC836_35555 [Richelia sp. RM2_1_2]|nr:hypothetical protein [Richelia sp. RM2_1_2]
MHQVKLLAHKALPALEWLCENIVDLEYKDLWNINGLYINPDSFLLTPRRSLFDLLIYAINLNNTTVTKTHIVYVNFKREEDAVWFKTTWDTE